MGVRQSSMDEGVEKSPIYGKFVATNEKGEIKKG
jgi:hypothetical protein